MPDKQREIKSRRNQRLFVGSQHNTGHRWFIAMRTDDLVPGVVVQEDLFIVAAGYQVLAVF